MSQNEDYLDSLLRSVTSYKQELNKKSDISQELISREMDDFAEFDSEIGQMLGKSSPGDDDEFIREFEKELLNDKELFPDHKNKEYAPDSVNKNPEEEQGFFDRLNQIVNAQEPPKRQEVPTPSVPEPAQTSAPAQVSVPETQPQEKGQEPDGIELPDGIVMPEVVGDGSSESSGDGPEPELMDLLSSLSSDDENLGELNDLLKADEDNIDIGGILNDSGIEEQPSESLSEMLQKEIDTSGAQKAEPENKNEKKNSKKKEKDGENAGGLKGFFQKLLNALGGSDDDEEEEQIAVPETQALENISEENLEILRELEGENKTQEKGKKGRQKKEKKEKKEKKGKEPKKPKKEKAKKPPKPKKEKKPKEKMPPVPKGPLIVSLVLGASIFVLIFMFTNLQGNTRIEKDAENYFSKGDYTLAYETIEGYTITDKNQELYDKIRLMAFISQQRDAFYYFEQVGMHENALDALVRGVQRYEKYVDEAASYGLEPQYSEIRQEIEQRLKDTFLMSVDDAKNLYSIQDKTEYTNQVYKIVAGLGLGE
ncbi:MAG: hypothetical protein HFG80_02445 [Eubacterium sp.]|nr:hypothetical protein [Eubacterium sp.]